jgi:hypothetical protein
MNTIEIFIIICTVVLFCSWGYIIWTNTKSEKLIRFPPYGFDPCPIGYIINEQSKDKNECMRKNNYQSQDKNITTTDRLQFSGLSENITPNKICNFFDKNKNNNKYIWDGIPTHYSHKDPTLNQMHKLLENCCETKDETNENCDNKQFSSLFGHHDLTLD